MSVYRITGKGSWSSMSKYEQSQAIIKTYLIANDFLNNKYADVFYNWVLPKFQSFNSKLLQKAEKDIWCENNDESVTFCILAKDK